MLSRAQIEGLLRRCERQRRLWALSRLCERWAAAAWPGLSLLLLALAIARALGYAVPWAGPVTALALLGTLLWTWRERAALRVPAWWLPARVDRAAGAHGALMLCFETSAHQQRDQPVPLAALTVPLAPKLPRRELLGAILFALAYGLCLALPVPDAQARTVVPLTPLPVQRAQRLLARVEPKDATTRLFVESSKRTLQQLGAKAGGLERADFAALERIEDRAKSLLERQADASARRNELDTLRELDSLLASYEAAEGAQNSAGALRDALQREQDALERSGLSREQLERMLEQARAGADAARQQGKQGTGQGAAHGFDPEAANELRQALRQAMREIQQGDGKGDGDGQDQSGNGGVDRGPGVARLALSEQSEIKDAHFESNTFDTRPDQRTVLLGTGLSRREDTRHRDAQGQSTRAFEAGNDTQLWPKHIEPRHRAVLEHYFETSKP
jgi:hypothetical protein